MAVWDQLTDNERLAYVGMANHRNKITQDGRTDWTAQEIAEQMPPLRLRGN
jgi:hypothetical protein